MPSVTGRQPAGCRLGTRHDTDDKGDLTAVEVVLQHGVARIAAHVQAAEDPLEVAVARDLDRLVDGTPSEEVDKRGIGGADAGDGMDAAGNLLDVNARIRV